MKVLVILSYFIVSSGGVSGSGAPQAAAQGIAFVPKGVPSSQYHAQDELGQYSYGYSNSDGQAKAEIKGIDGSIAGKYSYIDANGKKVEVSYIADKNGFRAIGDHLPSGVPVMPDHLKKAYEEANTRLAEAYSNSHKGKEKGEGEKGGEEEEEEEEKSKGNSDGKGGEKEEEEEEEEEEDDDEEKDEGSKDGKGGSEEEKKSESKGESSNGYSAPASTQQQPSAQPIYGYAQLGYAVAPVAYLAVRPAQIGHQSGQVHSVKAHANYAHSKPTYYPPAPVVHQPPPLPVIKPSPAGHAVFASRSVKNDNAPPQTVQSYVSQFYNQPPQVHLEPSRVYFSQVSAPPGISYGGYGVVQSHPTPSQYVAQASHVVPQVAVYSGPHLIGKSHFA